MKVVKIHKQSMIRESEDIKQLRDETEKFRLSLIKKYPQLQELYFGIQVGNVLHISSIKVKLEDRHQGVGSNVIGEIKKFPKDHKLVITLSREPKRDIKRIWKDFTKILGLSITKVGIRITDILHSSEALCIINHISMRGYIDSSKG